MQTEKIYLKYMKPKTFQGKKMELEFRKGRLALPKQNYLCTEERTTTISGLRNCSV